MPDATVQESRERVRAAIKNSNFIYPFNKRITVNLAPADLRKEGPAYDLPGAGVAARCTWAPYTPRLWTRASTEGRALALA